MSTTERIVDIVAVVVISFATIATAWCGYQAARWSALQTLSYHEANDAQIASAEMSNRSIIRRADDLQVFLQYEAAAFGGDAKLAKFLYDRFPPELKSATDAWLKSNPFVNRHAPLSPFSLPRMYHLATDEQAARDAARANDLVSEAVAANDRSDRYILLTVLFASSSFLGGLSVKLRPPFSAIVLALAACALLASSATMAVSPVR